MRKLYFSFLRAVFQSTVFKKGFKYTVMKATKKALS